MPEHDQKFCFSPVLQKFGIPLCLASVMHRIFFVYAVSAYGTDRGADGVYVELCKLCKEAIELPSYFFRVVLQAKTATLNN
jgi:hypothetical protein